MDHDAIFDDPELAALIGEGISGVDASPTIVQQAAAQFQDSSPKLEDAVRNLLAEADEIVHHEREAKAVTSAGNAAAQNSLAHSQKAVNEEEDDVDAIINAAVNNVLATAATTVGEGSAASKTPPPQQHEPKPKVQPPPPIVTTNLTPKAGDKPTAAAAAQSSAAAAAAAASSAMTVTHKLGMLDALTSAFSMEEENTILNDILKSLEDCGDEDDFGASAAVAAAMGGGAGLGLGEVTADGAIVMSQVDLELEAAFDYAERIVAASTDASGNTQGTPVLKTQEIAIIKGELEKARISAGAPCCVDNCLKWSASSSSSSSAQQQQLHHNGGNNAISKAAMSQKPIIAIGTTLGMVLLFNAQHKLCGVCGTNDNKGATTAVSFARGGSAIVAGYEGGQITLWDADTLHPLKVLEGEFSTAIAQISFCHPDPTRFVAMDAFGNVKIFQVNSVMGKHVSRANTLHTGYDVPASCMSVTTDRIVMEVAPGSTGETHKDFTYVATICSQQLSVFVVSFGIQTSVSLAFSSPAPRRGANNPLVGPSHELVAWIEDSNQRKLVVCWSNIIEVYHVLSDYTGHVTLQRTSQLEVPSCKFVATSPLDGCCVLFVDEEANLHVFDATHVLIAQTVQLAGTFDLVTFPFPLPPQTDEEGILRPTHHKKPRCYGQISHNGGVVTLQGKSRFAQCFLKTWEERVNDLLYAGQWDDLFRLAKDLSQDMAVAVVGLSADPGQRRANIHRRVGELMNVYITQMDAQLKAKQSGGSNSNKDPHSNEHLIPVIEKIITFCHDTQLQHLYFTSVMTQLEELGAADRGLYALEAALVKGKFTKFPEAVYISNFTKLFRSPVRFNSVNRPEENPVPHGMSAADHALRRMELALARIEGPPEHLDLLITTAETLKLARLKCTILSLRQHKYVEALQSLLPRPEGGDSTNGVGGENANGNSSASSMEVAFVYLERLFDDKSLVDGERIIPWYRKSAKESVITHLVTDPRSLNELLKHDATRLINLAANLISPPPPAAAAAAADGTLALAAPPSSVGAESPSSPWSNTAKTTRSEFAAAIYAQVVDTAISPAKPWEYERKKWPSYGAILQIYITMALPVASGLVNFPSTAASDDFVLRAALHFTYAFEKANFDRRVAITNAFVKLIGSSKWSETAHTPMVEVEVKSKRLGRAHASLLAARGEYSDAIACFLGRDYNQVDPYLAKSVFGFISNEMKQLHEAHNYDAIDALRHAVKTHLGNLIHVDAVQLSQLVFEHLPNDHHDVFRALQGIGDNTFLLYMRGMIAKGDRSVKEDKYAQNVYIAMLCKHERDAVYDYLVKNDSEIQYDLGQALHDCQKYSVTDATIFLLEKTVQLAQAMEALMVAITEHLQALRQSIIEDPMHYSELLFGGGGGDGTANNATATAPPPINAATGSANSVPRALLYDNDKAIAPLSPEDERLAKMVNLGVDLCSRYNQKLSIDNLKLWWFRLVDRFAQPKKLLHDREAYAKSGGTFEYNHNPNLNHPQHGYDENEIDYAERISDNGSGAASSSSLSAAARGATFTYPPKPLTDEGMLFLTTMQCVYSRYVTHLLRAMIKALPLSTVVGKIVHDNERNSFGPFKPLIVGILETLSFDLDANRLCKLCADGDTLQIASELRKTATSAILPHSTDCGICHKHLSTVIGDVDSLRLYPCGHGFHEICCGTLSQCYICSDYEEHYGEHSIGGGGGDDIPAPNKQAAKESGSAAGGKKGGGAGGGGSSAEPQNVDYIMRRLRQVRGKMDNSRVYKDMLTSIVKGQSSSAPNADGSSKSKLGGAGGIIVDGVNISDIDTSAFGGGSNLLLAPPQVHHSLSLADVIDACRDPITVPSSSSSASNQQRADQELTEEDLVAIFGQHAYAHMKETAAQEAADLRAAWSSGAGGGAGGGYPDDEEEWESEQMKVLMGLQ